MCDFYLNYWNFDATLQKFFDNLNINSFLMLLLY